MKIPSLILRQLYTTGSLDNLHSGYRFDIKNRLSDASLETVLFLRIDGENVPLDRITLETGDTKTAVGKISAEEPLEFPLRKAVRILVGGEPLAKGKHEIALGMTVSPFGDLEMKVVGAIAEEKDDRITVPADKEDNFTSKMVRQRQRFAEKYSGKSLKHVLRYSFDPRETEGNVENFTGVAQVPIGLAGPLKVNGAHAQGEYLIPMATTEGTLVASYNRGIKVLNLAGGVSCTVQADCMQRAPVFVFDSAREALAFQYWVEENMDAIRHEAESTSRIAKLLYIDTYLASKFAYLRFNFSTGDAAGQNMVGRATFAACSWILENCDSIRRFFLESNLATDKKASQINVMRTRGKRVTAEAIIPRDILIENMRVEPEALHYHAGIANIGSFLSGANNNGCHSPNGITAMYIATGQDVANVSEASAGIVYTELHGPDRDLYISITIPSLIVASYGGGTGLATQRECLELMDCYGQGRVKKYAEIVAGVVLAGELSLAAAISALDWVSSHEKYGRNR